MKKLSILFFLCSLSCYSQVITKKQQTVLMAFGYVHNQQETLKYIKLHFPEQHIEADIAEGEFNNSYGIALSNINLEVKKIYGNTFESYASMLDSNLRAYFKSNKMTKKESLRYIEHVKMRAKGSIESPILEILMKYQRLNFSAPDLSVVYHVNSYTKGEKINLSIEMPKNWKELDNHSSSALKMFRSNKGNGNEIISIQRTNNTSGIPFFTKKMLLNSVPKNSHLIASYKKLLNNEYVDVLEYEEVNSTLNSNQKRVTTRYYIISNKHIFIVDCSRYGTTQENLRSVSQRSKQLYESIVKSIRLTYYRDTKNIIATTNQN